MPALKTYVGFISHAWDHHDDYDRLTRMLATAPNFNFRNSSVPRTDPIPAPITTAKLTAALDEQIRITNVVLILAGMYAAHSDWVNKEIAIAAKYQKPIIGVKPWGQQRIPDVVQTAAKEMVGWNTDSIVAAIRKHAL
ncbi:TIR domain-containing protein [Ralstonia pseudosolanacearum]